MRPEHTTRTNAEILSDAFSLARKLVEMGQSDVKLEIHNYEEIAGPDGESARKVRVSISSERFIG